MGVDLGRRYWAVFVPDCQNGEFSCWADGIDRHRQNRAICGPSTCNARFNGGHE